VANHRTGTTRGHCILKLHGLDQRNRFAAKCSMSALMKLVQKALVCCNKLAFAHARQRKVHTIIGGWLISIDIRVAVSNKDRIGRGSISTP
jgi:hypothetical protein